jgi:GNAT superfamily N-acetyltransferase
MPDLTITREDDAPEADVRHVGEGLNAYNTAMTGTPEWSPVRLFLRDGQGAPAGGLFGSLYFRWMFVSILWVEERHRGGGYGRELLRRAEAIARASGCHSVWLDTFSFQAPEFYRKMGYEEFGRLEDYPPGHSRIYFRKRLIEPKS